MLEILKRSYCCSNLYIPQDDLFGNDPAIGMTPQIVLQDTTGYRVDNGDCESSHNCLQEDGSGWLVVQPRDMDTKTADHCFFWPEYSSIGTGSLGLPECCMAKTNPDYNENPFNDNYYCGDLVPSDASVKCPPQNKAYAMLPSHKWLADTVIETSSSRTLRVTKKGEQVASSSETQARDLSGIFATREEGSCNLCGGKKDLILPIKASQKMIDYVNEMTDSEDNPGGIVSGYLGQYNSCGQFEEALSLSEVHITKNHCLKLRKQLHLTVAVYGAASSCDVTCPQGERLSSDKKLHVDDISNALGLSSSNFSDEEVTCQELASRIELMASFVDMQREECEALQSAASHCCVSGGGGTKSGKGNKTGKARRG